MDIKAERITKLRMRVLRKWRRILKEKKNEYYVLQRQTDNTRKALWNGLQDPDGEWYYLICCAEAKMEELQKEIEKTKCYLKRNNYEN